MPIYVVLVKYQMIHFKIFWVQVLKILGILPHYKPVLTLNGRDEKIRIPIVRGIGLEHFKKTESWMIYILRLFPGNNGLFIDVGANIGQTLLHFIRQHPCNQYLGFEPNTACFHYLQNLVSENKWHNITLINKALSIKTGESILRFYGKQVTDSSATLLENFRPGQKIIAEQTIQSVSWVDLNSAVTSEKISWIKIDVEGSEWDVIQTLATKIQEDLPHIIIEILPVYYTSNLDRLRRQELLENTIKSWGYKIWRINTNEENKVLLEEISSIGIHGDMSLTNYILVHTSRSHELNQ